MRLIDADDFLDLFYVASAGQDKLFIQTVEMVAEGTPTIDAVPVVRCKDCKWYKRGIVFKDTMFCYRPKEDGDPLILTYKENDFCSCGERRGEDGN